jgi:hypothetical protein
MSDAESKRIELVSIAAFGGLNSKLLF